jgi:hypothetical protein
VVPVAALGKSMPKMPDPAMTSRVL